MARMVACTICAMLTGQKAAGLSQNKVKNERGYGSNAVGNGQCCEGVHSLGDRLGANLIDNVTGDNQGHWPNVSEHDWNVEKISS